MTSNTNTRRANFGQNCLHVRRHRRILRSISAKPTRPLRSHARGITAVC